MSDNVVVILAATAVVAGLVWWFRRSRQNASFAAIVLRHSPTARISSRAELIDGRNHIPVALTLESSQIYYENADVNASLDIVQIDEVEYGTDLLTGGIAKGAVLRLRTHGRALEFVLDMSAAEQWSSLLPPHRLDQAGYVHAS